MYSPFWLTPQDCVAGGECEYCTHIGLINRCHALASPLHFVKKKTPPAWPVCEIDTAGGRAAKSYSWGNGIAQRVAAPCNRGEPVTLQIEKRCQ
jgi:hypothetical protein